MLLPTSPEEISYMYFIPWKFEPILPRNGWDMSKIWVKPAWAETLSWVETPSGLGTRLGESSVAPRCSMMTKTDLGLCWLEMLSSTWEHVNKSKWGQRRRNTGNPNGRGILRHIMPNFSHVIKFLSVSNQSSSLAIAKKSKLLFLKRFRTSL